MHKKEYNQDMGITEDLIKEGVVEASEDADFVFFLSKIRLKKDILETNGLEKFAARFGWTEQIKQFDDDGKVIRDEDGNAILIDNPKPAYVACGEAIQTFIRDNIQAIIDREIEDELYKIKEQQRQERLQALGFEKAPEG